MKKLAPIVLFVYNRPMHTQRTVEALQKNYLAGDSELIIFSDGPKSDAQAVAVCEVRQYIRGIQGFRSVRIVERETNYGLARSIIDGVTSVLNEYGRIIVLEDDLVTSPYFLKFMNDALSIYEQDKRVFAISGFSPNIKIPPGFSDDVYLTHRSSSWGWATWRQEWSEVGWDDDDYKKYVSNRLLMEQFGKKGGDDRPDLLLWQVSGKINSWAIKRGFTQFLLGKYTVYPVKTLVKNIGHDGSGVHCLNNPAFDNGVLLGDAPVRVRPDIVELEEISRAITAHYSIGFFRRVRKMLVKVLKLVLPWHD